MADVVITERAAAMPYALLANGRNFYKAARAVGYSHNYAKQAVKIRSTKAYKQAMEPFIQELEKERERILNNIKVKDLSKEKHTDLVSSLEKITKLNQLLNGKATERNQVVFMPSDIAEKNNIPMNGTDTGTEADSQG